MKNTYKTNKTKSIGFKSIECPEGITIEKQVALIQKGNAENEHIKEMLYGERREGVIQGSNIRTDKWEIAVDAMDKSTKSVISKRLNKLTVVKEEENNIDKIEPIQGTES